MNRGYGHFGIYQALEEPFAQALVIMFLVAEVHPFADGSGRMARVMMNAELVAGEQTRIFIASVYRNEYIASLKRLTSHMAVPQCCLGPVARTPVETPSL
ncbi:MAG: Fic family protein [Rhizomicrobium sp.]